MCGICGVFYFDGRPVNETLVREMSDAQFHRGPDEGGIHLSGGVGLGHRRLSIIDLSSGQQPLSNEDGSVWISFNGEIYNYLELHQALQSTHTFRTHSDTETIVHLYESDPENFVTRLRGMFAFAIWDQKRRTLVLARDRVGKKPLYYYVDAEKLVFGSEIKSILKHPALDLSVDEQAVSDYISLGYIPAPRSIYRKIRKLRAGHSLRVTSNNVQELRYWDISFEPATPISEKKWCELFLEEFRSSVDVRLMSEVPLGAFLSGGLDSSAVVAMMSRINDRPVKTNTVGFQEKQFDESGFGREVSEFLHTDHHERVVTPDKIETIEKLAWHFDEPFSDPSALPTYYVSQVAREKVTVALSGDGGDENFAGYSHYLRNLQQNRIRSFMPHSARRIVFTPLGKLYPKMDWAPRVLRAKSTLQDLSFDAIGGYVESMSTFRNDEKQSILSSDLKRSLGDYDTADQFREYDTAAGINDPLSRLQYLDIKTYLTDDILVKVDRTSMANSLEVRCPLLDHKLMELAATIPSSLKLKGVTGKYIFKRAIEGYLPKRIIYRQKMGFGIPMRDWFRNGIRDFARAQLLDVQEPYLSSAVVAKIWNEHQSGLRDRSWQLWNILMFRLWYGQRVKNGH